MSSHVPDGWSSSTVGELASRVKPGPFGSSLTKSMYVSRGFKIYGQEQVIAGDIKVGNYYIDSKKFDELSAFKVEAGDILISLVGTFGRILIVPDDFHQGVINPRLLLLRFAKGSFDTVFIAQQLKSGFVISQLELLQQGGTMGVLSATTLKPVKLNVPPLPEQQKIAAILTSVDEVIEKTQAQIDKLKDLKTGMMQELLTKGIGHTEFKDSLVGRIPAGWEVKRLEEVFGLSSGSTPPRKEARYFSVDKDSIPWVKTLDMHDGVITKTDESITNEAIENSSCKLLPIGTAIVAMYGGWNQIGRSGVLGIEATTNQAICALKPKEKVTGEFANYWLISKRSIWKSVAASSRKDPNITKQDVSDFLIVVPPILEQKEIVIKLDSFTNQVNNKKKMLHRYQSIKKALMQDLLTGKVRVNTEQANAEVAVG